MSDIKKYTKGDLTIVWQADKCIHAGHCVKEMPQVFNLKTRPWVSIDGDEKEAIIAQVKKCPSGALRIEQEILTENYTKVEVRKNGPVIVRSDIELLDQDGNEITRQNVTSFCRCSLSKNQPFCDGSHKGNSFEI